MTAVPPRSSRPREKTTEATSAQRWTIVLAGLGVFMTALDNMVVTTALPTLRSSLHASIASLEWTVNAYLLAFACMILTGTALGDRFGRRRMFVIGIGIFTAASVAAALSPNVGTLIAARVVQGAGAGVAFPLTLTLISEAFPVEKRGSAIGMWGALGGMAAAFGPLIGGAVISSINWHWIFWINVPVGIAVVAFAPSRLRESFGSRPRIDVTGVVLAAAGTLGITWALVRSNTAGWGSTEVLLTLIAGAAIVSAFIFWEARTESPMVNLNLFRSRGFATANAVSFFMYAGLLGALFMMTQLLQSDMGHSALGAGLRMLPWTAAPGLVSPLAGSLADRFGTRLFLITGMTCQAVGLGWIAAIATPGMGYGELSLGFLVAGIGIGLVFPTVASAVLGSVPASEAGVASGTNSTLRELGGVLGIAILAAVFNRPGVYASPHGFIAGFGPALWVAAGLSLLGVVAAVLAPGRPRAASPFPTVSPSQPLQSQPLASAR
jgi:EmrB/QacA subfamily drug resistance transporter